MRRSTLSRRARLGQAMPLRQMSTRREEELRASGRLVPGSTFAAPASTTPQRPAYTGPKRFTRDLVDTRSGRICEWPGCLRAQAERHHRLNRKAGGRRGVARARVNGAAWLLAACAFHHRMVTSASGAVLELARAMGWVLTERQDASRVPVHTRHHIDPVWLDDAGNWHRYEEARALTRATSAARTRATHLLTFYLRTAFEAAGKTWDSDNNSEVASIVDALTDYTDEACDRTLDAHRDNDPHIYGDGSTS